MYGQYNEDDFIFDFFGNKKDGKYLDIGAGGWKTISNTYLLYEQGWSGIAIDPFERQKKGWAENRPRDKFLDIAISDYDGKAKMSNTMMDSGDYFQEYIERKIPVYETECLKFSTLCERYPEIFDTEFFSLDVETTEDKVLSTVDFTKFKPRLICIEDQVRRIDNTHRWIKYLQPYYKLNTTMGGNSFYERLGEL